MLVTINYDLGNTICRTLLKIQDVQPLYTRLHLFYTVYKDHTVEMIMIKVFIGYDSAETVAFNVLSHSIHSHSSVPVAITPIMLSQLTDVYDRPRHQLASTEFSFSRFLTPFLCDYDGWAIFMDCDMLVLDDIKQLWDQRDERYAVQVVKHDHKPKNQIKFLDQPQTRYEKKNWSSVMLFNCTKCKTLTPEYVNTASGLELHQFKWLENDNLIGEISPEWNHLVGYDEAHDNIKNLHYTEGGPYFEEYTNGEFSDVWHSCKEQSLHVLNKSDIKSKSA